MPRHHTAIALLLLLSLFACTTNPVAERGRSEANSENDPFEPFNRSIHNFNDSFDRAIFRPAAEVYRDYMPQPLDDAVTNFFRNLDDITVFINDLLQLKWQAAATDLGRFTLNSTLGILGLMDVAKPLGLKKNDEDFGQTLAYWGVDSGPFLVLPFLGPSNLRDGFGRGIGWAVDSKIDIDLYQSREQELQALALYGLDLRANLLQTSNIINESGADSYIFIRQAYMQQRNYRVYDGKPPVATFDDLFLEK
ncbi:MAG: VacJ family lipoprotein [Gammaproteobacteria bacterium]|nr:VacJ family lipoprotein [Gammaproteobacteria bacterium]